MRSCKECGQPWCVEERSGERVPLTESTSIRRGAEEGRARRYVIAVEQVRLPVWIVMRYGCWGVRGDVEERSPDGGIAPFQPALRPDGGRESNPS